MGNLDSYQFKNRKLQFCFYILIENDLNVLLQICIFLKVLYMYKHLGRWGPLDSIYKNTVT